MVYPVGRTGARSRVLEGSNVDTQRLNERDTSKAYAGRLYTRWLRQISMTRARTVADRLRGASVASTQVIADAAAV